MTLAWVVNILQTTALHRYSRYLHKAIIKFKFQQKK